MNNPTSLLSLAFSRQKKPGLSTIESLLNLLQTPSLLTDVPRAQILMGNSKASRLCGLYQRELVNTPLSTIFPGWIEGYQNRAGEGSTGKWEFETHLINQRTQAREDVSLIITKLCTDEQWALVEIQSADAREESQNELNRRMKFLEHRR